MKLKILTLNAWLVPLLSKYPAKRGERLAEFIKEQDFDLVFLQEIGQAKSLKKLTSLPGYQHFYSPSFLFGNGLLLISKFSFASCQSIRFKNNFHPGYLLSAIDWLAGKGFQLATIKAKKKKIVLAHTHLNSVFDMGKGIKNKTVTKIQIQQFKTILKAIDSYNPHRQPVILAGDFNFPPGGEQHRLLTKEFLDPFGQNPKPYTRSQKNVWWPLINPFGSSDPNHRIDYIFLDKKTKWAVENFQLTLNEKCLLSGKKIHLSDHFGLRATLKIGK